MVDHEPAARLDLLVQLDHRLLGIRRVLDNTQTEDDVELPGSERKVANIGLKNAMVGVLREIVLIGLDGIAHVNRRHLCPTRQQYLREPPCTAADLENVDRITAVKPLPAL